MGVKLLLISVHLVWMVYLCTAAAHGQLVYQAEYESEADLLIYYTDRESDADLFVYYTRYRSQSQRDLCDGIWLTTPYQSQADFTYAVTEYRSRADILVYPAAYRSEASGNQHACAKIQAVRDNDY